MDKCKDWDNPAYYNIRVFKEHETAEDRQLAPRRPEKLVKIAALGANGQLGSDICVAFEANGDSVARLTHADLEIASEDSVKSVLSAIAPDLVINPAAMHHVEKCEADPTGAYAVNGIGARNVAKCAAEIGAAVAFISTDYVFGGEKQSPYVESDAPSPLNVYGITKVAGEHSTRCQNSRH